MLGASKELWMRRMLPGARQKQLRRRRRDGTLWNASVTRFAPLRPVAERVTDASLLSFWILHARGEPILKPSFGVPFGGAKETRKVDFTLCYLASALVYRARS